MTSYARFIRYIAWPDIVYRNIPVAEKQKTDRSSSKNVYCKTCEYLRTNPWASDDYKCAHDSNKFKITGKKDWFSSSNDFEYIELPKQKNRRNDCPHYSEKID